jgi:hypothetical protein
LSSTSTTANQEGRAGGGRPPRALIQDRRGRGRMRGSVGLRVAALGGGPELGLRIHLHRHGSVRPIIGQA